MSKIVYGMEKYTNYLKGDILLEINDVKKYLDEPLEMFIVLKGKVKVYFDKIGAKYTPLKIQRDGKPEDFQLNKLSPIEYGEMDKLGDFKDLLAENPFVTNFYYQGML
jgi:hypothetical protein